MLDTCLTDAVQKIPQVKCFEAVRVHTLIGHERGGAAVAGGQSKPRTQKDVRLKGFFLSEEVSVIWL